MSPFERWWEAIDEGLRSTRGVSPSEEDTLGAFKRVAEQAFEAGIEEGWEQAEAHYQIDKG